MLFFAFVLLCVGFFMFWSLKTFKSIHPIEIAEVERTEHVTIGKYLKYRTISPIDYNTDHGLIFYPGARIESNSYIRKLSAISNQSKVKIVIGEPFLNLAFFSINQADQLQFAFPEVKHWYMGGHSLGGSMACYYASKHAATIKGVILLGTYCGVDISKSNLEVLSINGEEDGVFPVSKVMSAKSELPQNAKVVIVPGLNHAQFGDYGPQPGDNDPRISDTAAVKEMVKSISAFLSK
jgi:hypothetical protein